MILHQIRKIIAHNFLVYHFDYGVYGQHLTQIQRRGLLLLLLLLRSRELLGLVVNNLGFSRQVQPQSQLPLELRVSLQVFQLEV